jgi:dihydrofolate reductase
MGRIIVSEFVSLDGVMQDPGGDSKWKHAGWSFKVSRGEEGDKFKFEETRDSEAILLGRVTYEGFAKAWPSVPGEFGDLFNNMPKYVVSSTLERADWKNSTILKGEVVKEVSALKQRVKGNIVVHGSARLVQTLLQDGLVDELRLMVYPVILGSGKRLFGDTTDKQALKLTESRTVGDGIAILIFEKADGEAK